MALSTMAQGEAVPRALEDLAQPHIDSFDYFLDEGMQQVIDNLEGIEVCACQLHATPKTQPACLCTVGLTPPRPLPPADRAP